MSPDDLPAALAHSAAGVARRYLRVHEAEWVAQHAADSRLRAALADAEEHRRVVDLGIWRDYHGAICRSASSLAIAIFAHGGVDLDDAVRVLGPDGVAEAWLMGRRFGRRARKAWRRGGKVNRDLPWADEREWFLHSWRVVRRRGDARGALGVRFSAHGLEVGFSVGGVLVRTEGDEAVLQVEHAVPETIKAALTGRPVRDLIDHPVLRDPALVVMGVDVETAPYSLGPDAFTLTVRARRVPWRAPWVRRAA